MQYKSLVPTKSGTGINVRFLYFFGALGVAIQLVRFPLVGLCGVEIACRA
jgi:hypothetical protein